MVWKQGRRGAPWPSFCWGPIDSLKPILSYGREVLCRKHRGHHQELGRLWGSQVPGNHILSLFIGESVGRPRAFVRGHRRHSPILERGAFWNTGSRGSQA